MQDGTKNKKNILFIGVTPEDGYTASRIGKIKNFLKMEDIFVVAVSDSVEKEYEKIGRVIGWSDAIFGKYEKYKFPQIPVDDDIISKVDHYGIETLHMMKRMGRRWDDYEKRETLFLKHLKFWNSFLDYYSIGFVFFSQIPHEMYDYIVYVLSKENGIRTCMGDWLTEYDDRFPNKKIFISNLDYSDKWLEELYNKIVNEKKTYQLSSDQERRYKMFIEYASNYRKKKNRVELHVKSDDVKRYYSCPGNIIKHLLLRCKGYIDTWRLFNYYQKRAIKPNEKNEKYIYVPLHYEPECTTCPQGGGVYSNQFIMVDILSAATPDDIKIYVKEHPLQAAFGRRKEFYDQLLSVPKVELVRQDTNQFELLANCIAVSTLIGTAGYECQYVNKPFIMFGYYISRFLPGTVCARTVNEVKVAIKRIINGDFPHWSMEDIRDYLHFIDEVTLCPRECTDQEFITYLDRVMKEYN